MRRHSGKILIVAMALCTAVLCRGDVFMRMGGSSGAAAFLAGAEEGYRAKMLINGGSAQLTVLGMGSDFEAAASRLEKLCVPGEGGIFQRGDNMAFGMMRGKDRVERYLLVGFSGRPVVFRLDQSTSEFELSGKPPDRHMMADEAFFPGSVPALYLANDDTGTGLEISRATADPGAVMNHFAATLKGEGWMSPLPSLASSAVGSAMGFYVRGKELLCVSVTPGLQGRGSLVTVMRK